ncbi:MAG: alkane 1-monooxygenase [Bacteroidota bacterium]|jgi:alkane 1-monooxygenase
MKKIGFFSALILPALLVLGTYLGGPFLWMIHVFVFLLVPLMDYMLQKDTTNVPTAEVSQVTKERFYKLITFIWVYVQLALLFWGFYVVSSQELNLISWIAFTTGMALITGGIGITVAHELGHRTEKLEQTYAKVLLMTVAYMHFFIEHNRGHHVRVATPEDPATSRKGENFYAFWWRSVTQGHLSAWKLELERLKKKGLSSLSLSNQMIWFQFLPLLFIASVFLFFSYLQNRWVWEVPVFFAVQSVLGFSLLELVNYLEHYGMERRKLPSGHYEKVTPLHSWNASHVVSNFLLFQLQRHSDHHAHAHKRYQLLDHSDDSPQLPAGYSFMILVACVPPLWFSWMDHRLEQWQRERKLHLVQ